jgi:ribonuclease-3
MQSLENILGYRFKDQKLLELALTHASATSDKTSYERLEFLGDRILSLVIADQLYHHFSTEDEGALAKRHSSLVRQQALEKIASKIGLRSVMRVSSRDTIITPSMETDALEALFAAMYLDGGFAVVEDFITKQWKDLIIQDIHPPEDGKSALQEWAQARSMKLPEYHVVTQHGPDHKPEFTVEVKLADYPPQRAIGHSKQAAEKQAALILLALVRQDDNKDNFQG